MTIHQPTPRHGLPPAPPLPPPAQPSIPINLLYGEQLITLTSADQTYTNTGTTPVYVLANTGSDTINGGTSDLSTVDYSNLNVGVTLLPDGVVDKGLNGASGVDTLTDIKSIVGAAGQTNIVDASSITSNTISLSANLVTHALSVNNIPGLGSLSFNVYNFETINGTPGADTFVGDNRNDTFTGGAGSSFTTGTGHNILTGGGANDVFTFGGGHDTITNFNIAGGDVISSAHALLRVTDSAMGAQLGFAGGGMITLTGVTAARFNSVTTDFKHS